MDVISVEDSGRSATASATAESRHRQDSDTGKSWVCAAAVAAISVIATLAYAAPFGAVNQATYLLDPLHRAMPELFARDWFVSETPTYMPVFGWLAQWLFVIDPEGPTAFVGVHLIVSLATYAAIYMLVRALGGGVRAFAITAAIVTITRGTSMGGSYLLAGYLQPSSLATLGWLVALVAFVHARYLGCGIAAALAGAVHANFLVLGIGLFTLAGLARRDLTLRDHAKLLAPQLAVLACFVPMLLDSAGASDHAITILSELHAPAHYAPSRQLYWLAGVACWLVAGFTAMTVLADSKPARALWRFALAATAVVCAAALLVQLAPLRSLVQLFVSRIAPFAQLACIVLAAMAIVRRMQRNEPLRQRARFAVGIVAAPAVYVLYLHQLVPLLATAIGCVLLFALSLAPPRFARAGVVAFASITLAFAIVHAPHGTPTTRPHGTPTELELYAWTRAHTNADALFVIPPSLGRFRLLARRAVVVDTKSPPLRPDLLEQWYARLCSVVLAEPGPTARELEPRYFQLTAEQLAQVARTYGADYVVTSSDVAFPREALFRNARFAVYSVD